MAATARKNLWWLGPIALVLFLGIALPALAGRGSVTVSAAVDNSDNTYTLTVSSTSGITSGDHFGLTLSTGAGALYSVGTIDLLNSQITVIDNLYSYAESAPFGVPNSLPAAAWYGTPTTKGHPQVPWNAKGWDAFDRYSKALLDDQVVSSIPIPLTDGGTGASSASAARTSLGLDTMATQGAGAVAITGGTITGITDLAVADGGTGASSASAARTALGLAIGTNVQAYHAYLADLAGVTAAQGNILYFNGTNWVVLAPGTSGYVLQTLGAGANPQWASGATTVTVTEVDGSPSIAASTIKFTNGTVTDSGGGIATVTNSGGGGSPHDLLDGSTHQDTTAGTVVRGDLVTGQGATPTWTRLALGADNAVLSSDGTDVGYETLTSLLDSAFGSAQGSVLYRNGSAWVVLAPGTSGQVLQTQGAGANPQWANDQTGSGAAANPAVNGGRLTLSSTDTVTETDLSTQATLYFGAHNGNLIALYDDGTDTWSYSTIDGSVAVVDSGAGLAVDTNYDAFAYDSSGVAALHMVAWSSATARATSLVRQSGIWVSSADPKLRYVGTVRTVDDSTVAKFTDSAVKRFVANMDNRVERPLLKQESTASWTYATGATVRQANGDATNQVEVVVGLPSDVVQVDCMGAGSSSSSGANIAAAIGLDSTTTISTSGALTAHFGGNVQAGIPQVAVYRGAPGIGYHYFAWLESGFASQTITFYGTGASGTSAGRRSGLSGWVKQ